MGRPDFTHCDELGVMIAGPAGSALLYHFVMVYSRWEHVGVVLGGESSRGWPRTCSKALMVAGWPGAAKPPDRTAFRPLFRQPDHRSARGHSPKAPMMPSSAINDMDASRNKTVGEATENGRVEIPERHLKKATYQRTDHCAGAKAAIATI